MCQSELERIRTILLELPEVTERLSHGAPGFYVQGRRAFCYYHFEHRGDDRFALWCPAQADVRAELLANAPDRYFAPTPSAAGTFGNWLGVRLRPPPARIETPVRYN